MNNKKMETSEIFARRDCRIMAQSFQDTAIEMVKLMGFPPQIEGIVDPVAKNKAKGDYLLNKLPLALEKKTFKHTEEMYERHKDVIG
tara:strand:- start:1971 stop:2231 length:261 start_codon:yes stop_codon:yes gene_type:complete